MKDAFYPFMLEREMSIWENQVEYNLSESGVHPMTMRDLFFNDEELIEEFEENYLPLYLEYGFHTIVKIEIYPLPVKEVLLERKY